MENAFSGFLEGLNFKIFLAPQRPPLGGFWMSLNMLPTVCPKKKPGYGTDDLHNFWKFYKFYILITVLVFLGKIPDSFGISFFEFRPSGDRD